MEHERLSNRGHVFDYTEVEDAEANEEVMETGKAQAGWAEVMDLISEDAEDFWTDEAYRMI